MEEKSRAIELLDYGMSVIHVATDLKVFRQAIVVFGMRWRCTTPPRKSGSGAPRKTSARMDKLLKREKTPKHPSERCY
ncbi:hypothetical protein E2C01_011997 [Portunus trituberculatus]|uniref:Uncharacterized protein n=1 Tax=Portunus trituberculatus TaxID=210409 RepID=A0A5B7DCY6_PORTR|nr:hypothetical protein [Portunus trituberculatus]